MQGFYRIPVNAVPVTYLCECILKSSMIKDWLNVVKPGAIALQLQQRALPRFLNFRTENFFYSKQ